MFKLAIIIPAYKIEYFENSLSSLAEQSCINFQVYVGDDCSPHNLEQVVKMFQNKLKIKYVRFSENIGADNIVEQWKRCVALTEEEEWIWLFSDDDIADPLCVEHFYRELELTNSYFDAYRFDTEKIDANNNLIVGVPENPEVEDSYSLAYHILLEQRGNSMPDHIFRKDKYIECGGYVNFAFGQSADWATSIKFSFPKGLKTIKGPKVKWRYSGYNISSVVYKKNNSRAVVGYFDFLVWLKIEFINEHDSYNKLITPEVIKNHIDKMLKYHYRGIPFKRIFTITNRMCLIFNITFSLALLFCLKVNYKILYQDIRKKIQTFLNRIAAK